MKPTEIHTLQYVKDRPVLFSMKGGELKLSGPDLLELLRAVLDKGVPCRFRAKGSSMAPFIRDDDLITVSPSFDSRIRPGDVGAFVRPNRGTLAVHRIVGKKDGYFLAKGDNKHNENEVIPNANLLGRVSGVERNGKRVSLGLGPERYLISFLNRNGYLSPIFFYLSKIIRPILKRLRF